MKTNKNLIAFLFGAMALQACQNTEDRSASSDSTVAQIMTDTTAISRGAGMSVFMNAAAIGGMMEVEVSTIAQRKGTSAEVKKFAERMVKDHTKINNDLMELAELKGIKLPASLPASDQNHIDEMQKMPAAGFDKHYMSMMMADHVKALDLFKSATTDGDIDVRKFATKALRTIERHYKMATEIDAGMK